MTDVDAGSVDAIGPAMPEVAPSDAVGPAPVRSRPDRIVRALLRIPERPSGASVQAAHSAFQRSMAISGLRCTLTYVVFPILVPVIGFSAGVGPVVGIVIGVTAIGCDIFTIRRFFAVDHRWRWPVSIVVAVVAGFLGVLLVQDIAQVA